MSDHDSGDATAPPASAAVRDQRRLANLLADVGEAGLRNILRLFMADMPLLQAQPAEAVASGNDATARRVLSSVHDSAAGLGLSALAALLRHTCLIRTPR